MKNKIVIPANRVLKFRVWNKETKKFYTPDNEGDVIAISLDGTITSGYIDGDMTTDGNENYIPQQFTGLLDRNGKEIYEGDIVRITDKFDFSSEYPDTYEIKYELNNSDSIYPAGFKLKSKKNKTCVWSYKALIIVGNIFETPELLK